MLCVCPTHADLVVIVQADSEITQLEHSEVINIFMGRYKRLPNGLQAQPLDIEGESAERREFYHKLVDKTLPEINAYWARLMFSGRTMPPHGLKNQLEVVEKVASDPAAIGYVERKNLTPRVKEVYALPQ